MTARLAGQRILVTRPSAQAALLCQLIESVGGIARRFPTLEIDPLQPDPTKLDQALHSDWLIFTSSNAVDFAIKAFNGKMPRFDQTRIAAVGEATAQALRNADWNVHCVPTSHFSSEGLLAEAMLQNVKGCQCVIVRGLGGRDKLERGLLDRGASVSYLEVYRRERPDTNNTDLAAEIAAHQLDAISITSVEALSNLLEMLDANSQCLIKDIHLIVVSQRIADSARQLGFKHIAVSQRPGDREIVETLTTLFNGENSGRRN